MTFRNINNILLDNGWSLIRVAGSHYQYKKAGFPYPVTLPNHNGKDISIGVIKDIEEMTGLTLRS